MADRARISVDEASRVIKDAAAKQPVRIELNDAQLKEIQKQWGAADPSRPAEITFYVGDRSVGQLKVASCAYVGDTCCA